MYSRKISVTDFFVTYKWRNDPTSIKNSKSQNRVSLYSHLKWFKNNLNSKKNFYGYIFFDSQNRKIGLVFFKKINGEKFLISINLNSKFRGIGHSNVILKKAIMNFRKEENSEIIAEIMNHNFISIKLFTKHNFKPTKSKKLTNFKTYLLKK
jgi:RimJ/RimL family protein N-acetyltransferase